MLSVTSCLFQSFFEGQSAPWDSAKKDENRMKNRYGNIIACKCRQWRCVPLAGLQQARAVRIYCAIAAFISAARASFKARAKRRKKIIFDPSYVKATSLWGPGFTFRFRVWIMQVTLQCWGGKCILEGVNIPDLMFPNCCMEWIDVMAHSRLHAQSSARALAH